MSVEKPNYMDPAVLSRITRLELRSRLVVEGFISGMHRSPYHGFSVEFAEYREYVPGDDIKHIDWKVWGRSDRFFLKQYEEETNLRSTMMLDCSRSMAKGTISILASPCGSSPVRGYTRPLRNCEGSGASPRRANR